MRSLSLALLLLLVPTIAAAEPITKRRTTLVANEVSVTTSATAIPTTAATGRVSLCIFNNGAVPIYIGPSGVTTSTGFPLSPGAAWCDDVGQQVVYGIVASGTAAARYLED